MHTRTIKYSRFSKRLKYKWIIASVAVFVMAFLLKEVTDLNFDKRVQLKKIYRLQKALQKEKGLEGLLKFMPYLVVSKLSSGLYSSSISIF